MSTVSQTQTEPRSERKGIDIQKLLSEGPVRIAVLVICLLWSIPTLGLFISSFRNEEAINSSGWWTVFLNPFNFRQWTLENYQSVIYADGMGNAFLNSLLVTIPAVVIPITIAAFAAYAFAWMEFPGRGFFFAAVVGLMVVPLHVALIPMLRLYTSIDLNGTYLGIWLAHTGFGMPLAVYLLYGYIANIPKEIMESAKIDGASSFQTFTRLVLPLSVPAIASFAIFQFLWTWNDLLVALVFLGTESDVAVLTSRLSELVGSRGQDWEVLTAGAFITMIVPLIIFFALQRYFVRGMMAGSVKG
jgi:alpha-glucoside transport system permease protein